MPANFPGAVWSPTTKNAGDTIQPAHLNDAQTEIVAIEDGYINGKAPLNSSNSTVANLSVTGNSTIAGSLNVTGNSTFAGSLTIAGAFTPGVMAPTGIITANAQPRCRVYRGSTQTLASGETALSFDSQDFNIGSIHSTGTNPSRLTVQSTGLWMFGATCRMKIALSIGNAAMIRFRKNGATVVGSYQGRGGADGNSSLWHYSATAIEQMTSTGDYMEAMMFQNQGSVESGNASSRVDQNECWAVKLA